jgi:heme-degrading monooxygenase HmoA
MGELAYTLAEYRVREGSEEEFVAAWGELAGTFSSLPQPPLWGTLIRHHTDRTLFYSFGPWQSPEHVRAMRESAAAGAAFARLRELCEELRPGDFEVVTHVDVQGAGDIPSQG